MFGVTSVVLFIIALGLIHFENNSVVLNKHQKPRIMSTPVTWVIFMVVKFVLTYGSITGIYYSFGLYSAVAALLIRIAYGKFTFHLSYRRQFLLLSAAFYQVLGEKSEIYDSVFFDDAEPKNDEERMQRAARLAHKTIVDYLRDGLLS